MARVIDQAEPVVVLVGHVIPDEFSDAQGSCQVLIHDDIVVDAPAMLRDFLVYISTPRLRSQVLDRISSEGGTERDLDQLIMSGRVLELPGGEPAAQLNALSGVRLIPMGYPVRGSSNGWVVWVGHTPEATAIIPISHVAAVLMWEAEDHEDLPATVQRLQGLFQLESEHVIRLALGDLDKLLALNLARLETVSPCTGQMPMLLSSLSMRFKRLFARR